MRLSTTMADPGGATRHIVELRQSSILSEHLPETQKGYVMRATIVIAIAALLTPAGLAARPLVSGLTAPVADFSAAKKKKKPAKVKEEYLKAAPGTGPSG